MGHDGSVTNPVLAERYQRVLSEPSDIRDHLETFVRTVEEVDATRVLELGVRYGVSAVAWLYALESRGHFWGVDCSFPVAAPGSDVNLLDPQGPLGVLSHFTFILGYCETEAVLNALPVEFDAILLDANHGYAETREQLRLYAPRVRKGGRFLLHDTSLAVSHVPDEPAYPVRTAMIEYAEAHGLEWSNVEHCNGLGTIYC